MNELVPVYYARFRCLASGCRHTCCAGWEIGIDSETAAFYRTVPGPFGEELRQSMAEGEEECGFVLAEGDRCPFLDGGGLCRIYTELGESALCQICRDHPRFRNGFSSWTETGLGLCCEEAARIILTEKERAGLVPLKGDGVLCPFGPEEAFFLAFRKKTLDILWERTIPLEARFARLEGEGLCLPVGRIGDWKERLLSLERLEDAWTETLESRLTRGAAPSSRWDLPLEQAAVYFLYRHLPGALEDGQYAARCALAVLLCRLLGALFACEAEPSMEGLADLARRLSAEIEYSDRNIPLLVEMLADCGGT